MAELLQIHESGSRAELEEVLSRSQNQVRVGFHLEGIRKFYFAELGAFSESTCVGVCSAAHGPLPQFLLVSSTSLLIVGVDCAIVCIDLKTLSTKFQLNLEGVFYSFHVDGSDDSVAVVHELGALRMDFLGDVKWSVNTDVVANAEIHDGRLALRIVGMPGQLKIDLVSGCTM